MEWVFKILKKFRREEEELRGRVVELEDRIAELEEECLSLGEDAFVWKGRHDGVARDLEDSLEWDCVEMSQFFDIYSEYYLEGREFVLSHVVHGDRIFSGGDIRFVSDGSAFVLDGEFFECEGYRVLQLV